MEASSTTLNIQSPTVAVTHNHKPNFGRYVADCPKCMALHPDGPPKREKKAKPETTGLTKEDVIALLQQHAPSVAASAPADQMGQLVQLMLNREAKTLRKEDDEAKRREQARIDMVAAAKEQEALKLQREQNCETYTGHKKENGRTAISGQIHNDGLYHPFCQRCFKMFPPRRPQHEEISNAVAV